MATRMKFMDGPGRMVPAQRTKVRDDGDLYERTLVWESNPDQPDTTYDVVRDDSGKIFVYEIKSTRTADCGCHGAKAAVGTTDTIRQINDRNKTFWARDNGQAPAPPARPPATLASSHPSAINGRNREFWGRP